MDLLATRISSIFHRHLGKTLRSFRGSALLMAGCLLSAGVSALQLDVETTPNGEVFPTLELSRPALGTEALDDDGNGLLRIRLSGMQTGKAVKLQLSTPGLLRPLVIERRLEGDTLIRPRLAWDVDALRQLQGPRQQVLTVSISGAGLASTVRKVPIRVHPLDEALYFVRESKADVDLGWAFAAWVDPDHAVVDEILGMAGLIDTPRSPGRDERLRLAREMWIVLERRGLRYASERTGISQGPVMYSQRVRLLSSIWDDRVANCMDGSVLIASVLERLGIDSVIVLVPGHAFVGFYTGSDKREAEFLETTLLGSARQSETQGQVGEGALRARALAGFEAARQAGKTAYRRASPRLDGRHRPDFALIDISTARAYGIMPLAGGNKRMHRADVVAQAPNQSSQRPADHSP